jgi:hypothetical protein
LSPNLEAVHFYKLLPHNVPWHDFPEGVTIRSHHCENLKSTFIFILTCRSKYIDIGHVCLAKYINYYGVNLLEM